MQKILLIEYWKRPSNMPEISWPVLWRQLQMNAEWELVCELCILVDNSVSTLGVYRTSSTFHCGSSQKKQSAWLLQLLPQISPNTEGIITDIMTVLTSLCRGESWHLLSETLNMRLHKMKTARCVRVAVKHGLRDGEKLRVTGENFFKKRLTVVSENFRC
jgi:hypothetical protein